MAICSFLSQAKKGRPTSCLSRLWPLLPLLALLLLMGCTASRDITAVGGWSGVTMEREEVYVATLEGKVLRLNSEDGSVLWSYPESEEGVGPFYTPPAVSEERVYVGSYSGGFYAFWKDTGDLDWTQTTHGAIVGRATLADGKVLVGSSDGSVYCYDAGDGSRLWQYESSDKVWSAPVVWEGTVYFGSLDHHLYAVSLEDGSLVWSYETGGSIVARPLVVNGMVVVGAFDRTLYALDAGKGTLLWKHGAENWFWAGAITDGTTIYAASLDKKLYALDMLGALRWSFSADSDLVATPFLAPQGVMIATEKGRLHLISTKDGRQDWFFDVGESVRAPLSGDGSKVLIATRKSKVLLLDVERGRKLWEISTTEK